MFLAGQAEGGEVPNHKSTIGVAHYGCRVGIVVKFKFKRMVGLDGELWDLEEGGGMVAVADWVFAVAHLED